MVPLDVHGPSLDLDEVVLCWCSLVDILVLLIVRSRVVLFFFVLLDVVVRLFWHATRFVCSSLHADLSTHLHPAKSVSVLISYLLERDELCAHKLN